MELGHVHLKVYQLDQAIEFYRDVLELEVVEKSGKYAFLSWGEKHHTIALQEVPNPPEPTASRPGLYHVAFEVEDRDKLEDIYQKATERADRVIPVDHGISQSIYFRDPSENGIEVYVDTRDHTGYDRWSGRNQPLDLE